MLSAFTGVPLRSDTAVTGEITLRGRVLPVGGIKEKVLGALSSGIRRVVIPGDNARDLAEIPAEQLSQMEIKTVDTLEQAVDMLLYREESDA
jgi:ATP-dependent Lon protease